MSSPIDRIRDGITSSDWHAVCQGFAMLTGEQLDPPQADATVTITIGDVVVEDIKEAVERTIRAYLADQGWQRKGEAAEPDDEDDEQEEDDEPQPTRPHKAEPEPDPVSARAREVRDARASGKAPDHRETDYDKFKVQHGQQVSEKGKSCRVLPFEPGMTNKWNDDRTVAADEIKDSRKLSKKKKPEPRRPEVKTVKVTCCKCQREEEVNPLFAPKTFARGEESSYVCNNCIRGNRR